MTGLQSSTMSREGLVEARESLCLLLHEILNTVAAANEAIVDSPAIQATLNDITATCTSASNTIKKFGSREGEIGVFPAAWHERLQSPSARLDELQKRLPQESSGLMNEALEKVRQATSGFSSRVALISATKVPEAALIVNGNHVVDGHAVQNSAQEAPPVPASRGLLLIVDDNDGNRDVLARRLLREGYEIMLAEGGGQALKMLDRYPFDAVLLDIMMPEIDGYAVLAELKKKPVLRHLPVVMISALDDLESVVRCIQMGADDYLFKPFNAVLLRARIAALVDRKRLRDDERKRAKDLERAFNETQKQRKRSEELLLNILPAVIARELQANNCVQPLYFEDVTVAFADIVGFTRSTEELPAEDLVHVLHQYFSAFDRIIGRYGLEKLKTIGDCYMFAGGMPVRRPSHPVDSVLAAFEMIHAAEQMGRAGPVDWKLRIGIHTGPVIAGVVGIHKFAFDIWGDTVNLSSRMESSGEAARINLSAASFSRIKDFFACEGRGRIGIKHGGKTEMYFANGIATGLLSKGPTPRQAFEQRYKIYFQNDLQSFPEFLLEQSQEQSNPQSNE
jgi:adenylate cyclase